MNILIVNYGFPPAAGIGGRRWAKFAKYLNRAGHGVYVIAAQNDFGEKSEWTHDVKGLEIQYLSTGLPKILQRPTKEKLGGIRFRAASFWLQLKRKGNYYDKSVNFLPQLLKAARATIQEKKITHVITSGAPFHQVHAMLEMKREFPQVKFVSDFRDLWTTDTAISNFRFLSPERAAHERKLEKEVVAGSHLVLGVAPAITAYFQSLPHPDSTRFATLENGYDPDDFSGVDKLNNKVETDIIRIVFAGTVYPGMANLWNPLVDALALLKVEQPSVYQRLRFDFYGKMQGAYLEYAREKQVDVIHFHGQVPLADVYGCIRSSSLCLLILHDLFAFSLSTKFCEYLSQHKKILVLSQPGETSRFVEENKIGWWLNPAALKNSLAAVVAKWEAGEGTEWNPAFDVEAYSLQSLTNRLESLLLSL